MENELWMIDEGHELDHGDNNNRHSSVSSSIGEGSTISNGSHSSSLDTTDDASSSCSPNSDGAFYDLSTLMEQLPIKRGLSKFYQGKSQSFTSLSRVTSIEDLAKKETPNTRRKIKSCKSYGAGLDSYKSYTLPKPTILKKASRTASCTNGGNASFISRRRAPLIPAYDVVYYCQLRK